MRNALNIYKRKDGRFEGRIPFGRNDNGSLKYRYFYSKDLAELKYKMLSAYTSIEKYNTISCAKTLSEICAEWLSCAKLRVKRSSYCCYERNINKHILPYFKQTKYSELNSVKINAFIEYLLKNGKSNGKGGLSSKTIRDNIVLLRSVAKYAESEYGYKNPMRNVIMPKENTKAAMVFNRDERSSLQSYLMNDLNKTNVGILLAMYTGMRIGELCAVTAEDIDIQAEKARKLVIEGGHITLNGDYENLEEIKLDNWGGVQLIGNFPKLKYIYRTGNSDMNLAGDFPALECVYTMGGQILLGTGDVGFNADNLTVIDEYGPIVVYTAKDVNLTSSRLVTTQMILMRGAGADKIASRFNVENTLMAAINGVMFEDMNDNNTTRYGDLPVFYSTYPMSIINCNFKLLQGTFINSQKAIIMANANIGVFRGFMFSPEGVDEYRNSSAVGFYVNTYAYNISPNINSLNKQPNGTEEIGRISDFEYSDFPKELVSCIGDAENFLSGLENQDNDFVLGEMNGKPGELLIGRYILADEDIVISADTLKNRKNAFSVIASESGNITLNVKNEMDAQTIIYAPNGKVTLNVSTGTLHGRIFAKNIEIVSDSFEITGGTEDISYLGFVYIKDSDSESTSDDTSLTDSKTDSSKTDCSSVDSEDSSVNSDLDDNSTSQGASSGYDTSSSDSSSGNSSSLELSGSSSGDDSSLSGSDKFNEPQYEYDRLNRLIKVTYDEENYVEYMYDANGNITQIVTVIDGEEK